MHPKTSTLNERTAGPSRLRNQTLQQPTTLLPTAVPLTHVYINTLPPYRTSFSRSSSPMQLSSIHSQEPRPLRAIDPTISFTAPAQAPCQAIFQIYKAGQFLQQEYTSVSVSCGPLSELGTSSPLFTYNTALVPQFWPLLCEVEGNA
jgi:transcriptional enhancer factor